MTFTQLIGKFLWWKHKTFAHSRQLELSPL